MEFFGRWNDKDSIALPGLEVEPLPKNAADPVGRNLPLILSRILIDKPVRDLLYRTLYLTYSKKGSDDLKSLCFHIHALIEPRLNTLV